MILERRVTQSFSLKVYHNQSVLGRILDNILKDETIKPGVENGWPFGAIVKFLDPQKPTINNSDAEHVFYSPDSGGLSDEEAEKLVRAFKYYINMLKKFPDEIRRADMIDFVIQEEAKSFVITLKKKK